MDDAVSIEVIGEDMYRVGVHIADVSHFVKPGSELDKEAHDRTTSIYLMQATTKSYLINNLINKTK